MFNILLRPGAEEIENGAAAPAAPAATNCSAATRLAISLREKSPTRLVFGTVSARALPVPPPPTDPYLIVYVRDAPSVISEIHYCVHLAFVLPSNRWCQHSIALMGAPARETAVSKLLMLDTWRFKSRSSLWTSLKYADTRRVE